MEYDKLASIEIKCGMMVTRVGGNWAGKAEMSENGYRIYRLSWRHLLYSVVSLLITTYYSFENCWANYF